MWTVYELVNELGTIEYVGETSQPLNDRFRQHTIWYPHTSGIGKFYQRMDLSIHPVQSFQDRKDARKLEEELKIQYGMHLGERSSIGKNWVGKFPKSHYAKLGKKGGAITQSQMHTCPRCNKTMAGTAWLGHINKGTKKCPL